MSDASAALPDDVETLKRLVIGRDEMIAKLLAEIARLKRWRFGRSAERIDAALMQLQLALDDLQLPRRAQCARPSQSCRSRNRPSTPPQPARDARCAGCHAPCPRTCRARPSCTRRRAAPVPTAAAAMRKLGEDISELLDFIPGYFKVIRHVRPKLSCAHCARVIQLPAPSRPIERGMPAPGLLAQVIVAKYADHCPLYRQAGHLPALGRGSGPRHPGRLGRRRRAPARALGRGARAAMCSAAEKVHADDTPVPVLDPGRGQDQDRALVDLRAR